MAGSSGGTRAWPSVLSSRRRSRGAMERTATSMRARAVRGRATEAHARRAVVSLRFFTKTMPPKNMKCAIIPFASRAGWFADGGAAQIGASRPAGRDWRFGVWRLVREIGKLVGPKSAVADLLVGAEVCEAQ